MHIFGQLVTDSVSFLNLSLNLFLELRITNQLEVVFLIQCLKARLKSVRAPVPTENSLDSLLAWFSEYSEKHVSLIEGAVDLYVSFESLAQECLQLLCRQMHGNVLHNENKALTVGGKSAMCLF